MVLQGCRGRVQMLELRSCATHGGMAAAGAKLMLLSRQLRRLRLLLPTPQAPAFGYAEYFFTSLPFSDDVSSGFNVPSRGQLNRKVINGIMTWSNLLLILS